MEINHSKAGVLQLLSDNNTVTSHLVSMAEGPASLDAMCHVEKAPGLEGQASQGWAEQMGGGQSEHQGQLGQRGTQA